MVDPVASNPFHIARAYQLTGAQPQRANAPHHSAPAAAVQSSASPAPTTGLSRLVAGIVPGRIDFAGEQPAQVPGAIAMYRHPADRNIAATAVHAGRLLDTTA